MPIKLRGDLPFLWQCSDESSVRETCVINFNQEDVKAFICKHMKIDQLRKYLNQMFYYLNSFFSNVYEYETSELLISTLFTTTSKISL